MLGLFDLPVFKIDWSRATEDVHRHAQHAAIGINFFDDARLAFERTVGHAHRVAHAEGDLRLDGVLALADLSELQNFSLYRTETTRGSDTAETLAKELFGDKLTIE